MLFHDIITEGNRFRFTPHVENQPPLEYWQSLMVMSLAIPGAKIKAVVAETANQEHVNG